MSGGGTTAAARRRAGRVAETVGYQAEPLAKGVGGASAGLTTSW